MAAQRVESYLTKAQVHEEAGRKKEAILAYQEACVTAHAAGTAGLREGEKRPDQLLIAGAALGWARVVLQVGGSWPELLGRAPDDLLLHALEGAQKAKRRSRTLEGQIMLERSKALFAKPNKTAADLDAAVQTRYDALPLLQQGAAEGLPWKMEQAEVLMGKASETPLADAALLSLLRGELGGSDAEVENHFALLFSCWATPAPDGEATLAPADFLKRFLDVAKDLDRKVDRPPCAAPCEGGKVEGASPLEKELVALVSRDGDGQWEAKAAEIRMKGADFEDVTAESLQEHWRKLAPRVKKQVDGDAPMACGHSCSSCPTKDTCQMHDALKDIEDL